jgi:hypothetical protein
MAVDDVYQITVNANTGAGINMSSLHFIRTTEAEPVDADFLAVANDIKELHRAEQNISYAYTSWRARRIRGDDVTWPPTGPCAPVGGLVVEGLMTGTLPGGNVGEVLPWQCALVTTIRTSVPGRTRRGRVYFGGWGEAAQNAGIWSSTMLANVTNNWTAFFTEYAVAAPVSGFRLGVWSTVIANGRCTRNPDGTHTRLSIPNPDDAFRPAISKATRTTVFTQRRRVLGHGT